MRRRYVQWKQNQSGAAMVLVLCILSVFTVLAFALLLAASSVVRSSGTELEEARCKIGAVRVSDAVTAGLADTENELYLYVQEEIAAGKWRPGEGAARTFEGTVQNPEGEQKSGGAAQVSVKLYWEQADGLPVIGPDGAHLYVAVTYAQGVSAYRLRSEYELTCGEDAQPNAEGDKALEGEDTAEAGGAGEGAQQEADEAKAVEGEDTTEAGSAGEDVQQEAGDGAEKEMWQWRQIRRGW